MPSVSVDKVAMFEKVVEGNSRSHFVQDDFKNTADHIAFNHDDERSVVLISDVAQRDRVINDLFFSVGDFHQWAFVGEFDECCALSIE